MINIINRVKSCPEYIDSFNIFIFPLTLMADPDFDSGLPSYYMHIKVSDGVHNTKVWVLVQLSPINEFSPVALSYTVNVSEIAPIGSEVITYIADDNDASPHDVTSYQIINGKPYLSAKEIKKQFKNFELIGACKFFFLLKVNGKPDTFHIEKQTGKIYLASFLDYEMIPQYRIAIKVKDIGGKTVSSYK